MRDKPVSSGQGWTPEEEVKFLFSIVDSHGPVKWHDIPIPPGRSVKACREMLYRLKKRLDAGEGGIPKTKAPRKRKAAPDSKNKTNIEKCDYAPPFVKVEIGGAGGLNGNDNGDSEEDARGSTILKLSRASPKRHKLARADTGESDSDAIVKCEKMGEDDDVKMGAFARF